MEIVPVQVATRIVFVLGIVNLVTLSLIYLTCRCIPGSKIARITGNLMQYSAYKRFFGYHCYFWWILWISVITHALLGISLLGIPS